MLHYNLYFIMFYTIATLNKCSYGHTLPTAVYSVGISMLMLYHDNLVYIAVDSVSVALASSWFWQLEYGRGVSRMCFMDATAYKIWSAHDREQQPRFC